VNILSWTKERAFSFSCRAFSDSLNSKIYGRSRVSAERSQILKFTKYTRVFSRSYRAFPVLPITQPGHSRVPAERSCFLSISTLMFPESCRRSRTSHRFQNTRAFSRFCRAFWSCRYLNLGVSGFLLSLLGSHRSQPGRSWDPAGCFRTPNHFQEIRERSCVPAGRSRTPRRFPDTRAFSRFCQTFPLRLPVTHHHCKYSRTALHIHVHSL